MIATLDRYPYAPAQQLGATRSSSPPWWGWLLLVGGLVGGAWWAQRAGRTKVTRWRLGRLQRRAAKHRALASTALQEARVLADELGMSPKKFKQLVKEVGSPQEAAAEIEAALAEVEHAETSKRRAFQAAVEGASRVTGEPRVPGGKKGGRRTGAWTRQYEKLRVRAEEKHGVELPKASEPEFGTLVKELDL